MFWKSKLLSILDNIQESLDRDLPNWGFRISRHSWFVYVNTEFPTWYTQEEEDSIIHSIFEKSWLKITIVSRNMIFWWIQQVNFEINN